MYSRRANKPSAKAAAASTRSTHSDVFTNAPCARSPSRRGALADTLSISAGAFHTNTVHIAVSSDSLSRVLASSHNVRIEKMRLSACAGFIRLKSGFSGCVLNSGPNCTTLPSTAAIANPSASGVSACHSGAATLPSHARKAPSGFGAWPATTIRREPTETNAEATVAAVNPTTAANTTSTVSAAISALLATSPRLRASSRRCGVGCSVLSWSACDMSDSEHRRNAGEGVVIQARNQRRHRVQRHRQQQHRR